VGLPPEYGANGRAGRVMSLTIDEIHAAPPLPLSLPLPSHEKPATRCRQFLEKPNAQETIDCWSRDRAVRRGTFTSIRARDGVDIFRLATPRRSPCGASAARRTCHGACVRPWLFEPGVFATMPRQITGIAPQNYRRAPHTVRR
jgi:hypothetical protein